MMLFWVAIVSLACNDSPRMTGDSESKHQLLRQLLDDSMVLIALNAQCPGVDVPEHLSQDTQLRLNLSYRMGLPLELSDWGVLATLTFGGVPHACRIPWSAVFVMVSHATGQPYMFPDAIPNELLETGLDTGASAEHPGGDHKDMTAKTTKTTKTRKRKPKLTLVHNAEPAVAATHTPNENAVTPPPDKPKNRGHLKLVK